jgi:Ca2+-binding EF-hand superfamily protein
LLHDQKYNTNTSSIFLFQEVKNVFDAFDKDGSGNLDFDEFLVTLRVSSMIYVFHIVLKDSRW